jgi:hypothetical protein
MMPTPPAMPPYSWPPMPPWPPQAAPRLRPPPGRWRRALFGATGQSMSLALLLLGGAFLIASTLVVLRFVLPPPMMFQPAKKSPTLPARKLEHRIRVKQFEQQTRRPRLVNKLVSKHSAKLALPELPPMKLSPTDARTLASALTPAGAHLGQLGLGGFGIGASRDSGLKGFSEAVFFGQQIRTRAFVVLLDNSPSVRVRGVVAAAQREMTNLVNSFHPDTQFNVIVYRDGAGCFRPQMVFATQQGKADLHTWFSRECNENSGQARGYGTTPLRALQAALAMKPDTIVLIRDDQPPYLGKENWNNSAEALKARAMHAREIFELVRQHNAGSTQRVMINTLLFKPADLPRDGWRHEQYREAVDFLRTLATMTGGRFREVSGL